MNRPSKRTPPKRAEERLRETENRFRFLIESIPHLVWTAGPDGALEFVNDRGLSYGGITLDQLKGWSWTSFLHPEDVQSTRDSWEKTVKKGCEYLTEYRLRRASDGQYRWHMIHALPFRDARGNILRWYGTCTDIHDHKQAEAENKLNEVRLESLLRISQYRAPSMQALLDYALDEAIALTASKIGYIYQYDDTKKEFTLNTWSKDVMKQCAVAKKQTIYQLEKTGLWGEAVRQARPIMVNEFQAAHPLKKGCPEGHAPLFKFLTVPVFMDNRIVGVVGVANKETDYNNSDVRQLMLMMDSVWKIAERKKAEDALLLAQENLRHHIGNLENIVQERTAELQKLVGEWEHFSHTITHDLRGPLRSIQGFAQVVEESSCPDCDFKDFQHRITLGASRMDQLITDALNYTRAMRGELQLLPINIEALLGGILSSYPNLQPDRADIVLSGRFPLVLANELALTQCFSNLLGNAIKFVAPGRRPRVVISAEVRDRQTVRLWFKDNGIGIAKVHQKEIFCIFHRVSNQYEGTGIGLALIKKNVERMGGKVGVESAPGRGSRFWIELKIARAKRRSGKGH